MDIREVIDEIIDAIDNNNLEKIKEIIAYDQEKDEEFITLHMAVIYSSTDENLDILKYLLNCGRKISKETIYDALIQACTLNAEESVKLLIKNCKGVNLTYVISEYLVYSLDEAPDNALKILTMLLNNGINMYAVDRNQKTALEYVIDTEDEKLIMPLLKYHAYPRYNKDALIGYTLRDFDIAQNDLEYLLNSNWYINLKQKKDAIKNEIKSIQNYKSEEELEEVLRCIAKTQNIDIEKCINKNGLLDVAYEYKEKLQKNLKEINRVFETVENFKSRIELHTRNNILKVVNMCKENGRNNLSF